VKNIRPIFPHLPFLLVIWLFCGFIYIKTLAPSILYIDAGTMIAAAFEPGIPNPPGFPFYVMIGHLFTKIPFGSVLFRMQLLSVLAALGVLTWVYFLLFRLISNNFWFVKEGREDKNLFTGYFKNIPKLSTPIIQAISLTATLILGFSYQFWSQTLNTESYILTNLMMISLLGLVMLIPESGKISTKRLILGAVILGLATGTNPTIVQSIPALLIAGIFLWKKVRIKRFILVVAIVLGLTALVYAYLPIRALQHPFINWGDPQTPELFWGHLKGEGLDINDPRTNSINGFTGSPQIFAKSVGRYFYLLFLQFTPLLVPLILIGGYYLLRKNWRLFLMLISVPITNLIFGGLYLSGNQESWFIASYVIFTIFIGIGLSLLIKILLSLKQKFLNPKSIFFILFVLVLVPFLWWLPKLDRSAHITTSEYADNLYSNLPKGAVLIGSGDFFNSLSFYEYDVIKNRPDVFPVVANMWYILPWYRDNLRTHRPDLMPKELEGMIKKDRLEEYNEVMNWYIKWLIDHGHPVYVTPMVFRETVLAGTDAGKFKLDPKLLKPVISGLSFRMLTADDLLTPSDDSFAYKFKDPKFFEHKPFYLERNYNAAYHLLLQEYGMSYIAMEDYLLGVAQSAPTKEDQSLALKKAEEYILKAYAISPFSVEVANRMAIFAANKGDMISSIKYFKEAVDLEPGSFEVRLNLAKAYLAGGQVEEAKKQLQFVIGAGDINPQIKQEAQNELAKITGQELSSNIASDWKTFEQKKQGFSFKYPGDWKITEKGKVATLSVPDSEFTISFYGGSFAGKPDDWVATSLLKFPGKLDKKGLAQIPGFEATAAFWVDSQGIQTLEFVLSQQKSILHLKVSPVGDKNMQKLDTILSSIKFI
jgi:tetratricopeptide (TPR) repeat protein